MYIKSTRAKFREIILASDIALHCLYRCLMMRKLLEHFRSSPVVPPSTSDPMETFRAGVNIAALQERFSREFTSLYLKVADSAQLQSNYAVARKYLQLTERAINEVCF